MALVDLPDPFDAHLTISGALGSSFGNHYHLVVPGCVRGLLPVGGRQTVVEFGFRDGLLSVSALGGSSADDAELTAIARRVWSLTDDLAECQIALEGDAEMGGLAQQYRGYRLLRAPSLWESFVVAVVGQAVSAVAARAIRRRMALRFGTRAEVEGHEYLAHPEPEQMLAAEPDEVRGCGLTGAKVRCLMEVARRAGHGELAHERLADLNDQEALEILGAIPGVGPWTTQVVLIYGLGRNDVWRPGDRALANAVQRLYGLETRPIPKELEAIGQNWRPWRSYAAAHLLQQSRGKE